MCFASMGCHHPRFSYGGFPCEPYSCKMSAIPGTRRFADQHGFYRLGGVCNIHRRSGNARESVPGHGKIAAVFASKYACGVGETQGGLRLGLRAVGLENQPTCAAHLDIGRRRKPLFWAAHVERLSEPSRSRDPSVGWRRRLVRFLPTVFLPFSPVVTRSKRRSYAPLRAEFG